MAEASSEDYAAAHATQYKEKGNACFKAGDFAGAVGAYSEAIALDPSNHVLYSNRSGTYLAMGGAISKAFKDAERCVELKGDWPKGYSRRGAAESALGRFVAAQASYRRALELDPENATFVAGLAAAREGEEQQTRERIEEAKREAAREAERAREKAAREAAEREAERAREELSDFFTCLEDDKAERAKAKKQATNPTTEKYAKQKLGTGAEQIARLTPSHADFKNLDPFRVLALDVDATPDDIKARYRKLSTLCHPDKNGGGDDARKAFEYVKDAHLVLSDPKKRDKHILVIEAARKKCADDRALRVEKQGIDPNQLPPLDEAMAREVMKTYARNEMKRRDADDHQRVHANREREQEAAAKKKDDDEKAFEKQWNNDDRRADRIDFWNQFQDDAKRAKNVKRQRTAVNFKMEEKVETKPKFGQADMESWKKEWK